MNLTKSHLGFELPVPVEGRKTKLDLSTEGIKNWCAKLPMTQTGYVAREIHFALQEILQASINQHDLFTILDLLQPAVQWVCQGLKKHYLEQQKPLDENQLIIVNLSQTLQINLIMGYKKIIDELGNDKINNKNIQLITAAIFRVLHYSRLVLLCSYQLYTEAPHNFWKELYILYSFSQYNDLLTMVSPDDKQQTIEANFKMIFLLTATVPYQWRQMEQELINAALETWVQFVNLHPTKREDLEQPGLFMMDLQKDQWPGPATLKKLSFTDTCVTMNVSSLAQHLRSVLDEFRKYGDKAKQRHPAEPEYNIPINALQILAAQWATPAGRKESRVQGEGEIEVVFGYAAVHYFINGKKAFDTKKLDQKYKAQYRAKSDESKNLEFNEDQTKLTTGFIKSGSSGRDFSAYMCKVLDTSRKGLRILWRGNADVEMIPGRIVGFKSVDSVGHTPWVLGFVMWIKRINKDELLIGIENLEGFAEAAAVQLIRDSKAIGNFLASFVLPKIDKIDNKPTIITPAVPFKEGDTVRCAMAGNSHEQVVTLHLQQQIYDTRNFRQFEFQLQDASDLEIMDERIKKFAPYVTGTEKGKEVGLFSDEYDSKFDAIWSELD